MGVSSRRASVAELAFRVFNRPLHPEWFSSRQFRRITHKGWEADIRIIEGGHLVIFRSSSVLITEVLSGPETTLPETGVLFNSNLHRERSAMLRPGGTLEYQSCLSTERIEIEIFRHLCEEITLDVSSNTLFDSFRSSNRLAPSPISHLRITARSSGLSIQSIHTFPDECAIVRTQSIFEVRAPAARY
jgi:Protein of unknown function DUF2617